MLQKATILSLFIALMAEPTAAAKHGSKSGPQSGSTPQIKTTDTGLQYTDLKIGNGQTPEKGDIVIVQYTGTLPNGKKFDSSYDRNQPFRFTIGTGEVIKGWDQGISSMSVGGKRRLVVPPQLAYGNESHGNGAIPANSTLHFDVELIGIEGKGKN